LCKPKSILNVSCNAKPSGKKHFYRYCGRKGEQRNLLFSSRRLNEEGSGTKKALQGNSKMAATGRKQKVSLL
jgi:hypothetical protein